MKVFDQFNRRHLKSIHENDDIQERHCIQHTQLHMNNIRFSYFIWETIKVGSLDGSFLSPFENLSNDHYFLQTPIAKAKPIDVGILVFQQKFHHLWIVTYTPFQGV